jgi:hypothetical protein
MTIVAAQVIRITSPSLCPSPWPWEPPMCPVNSKLNSLWNSARSGYMFEHTPVCRIRLRSSSLSYFRYCSDTTTSTPIACRFTHYELQFRGLRLLFPKSISGTDGVLSGSM